MILEEPVGRWRFLRRRIAKFGLTAVAGQIAFRTVMVPWMNMRAAPRVEEIKRAHHLDESPIPLERILRVSSVNSDDCLEALQRMDPAVVIVSGTRIIAERVLQAVKAPFINLHAGITPQYRGVHGAYWALVDKRLDRCGVTIHLVDKGIDTGAVLGRDIIQPAPDDCFVTYHYLQLAAGIPLLKRVVREALEGKLTPLAASEGQSKLWTHPTLGQYLHYRKSIGVK